MTQQLAISETQLQGEILAELKEIKTELRRLSKHVVVAPKIVGTFFVAGQLGLTTTTRVAEMARMQEIPASCIVPGTGHGTLWKFYRERIESWINDGRPRLTDR